MIKIKHGHCPLIHGSSVFFFYILHRCAMYQRAVTMFYLHIARKFDSFFDILSEYNLPDEELTEQHLGIAAEYLETTERFNKAGLALGFRQYKRDTFREQCNSAWEAAHRMLVAWKNKERVDAQKWKLLLTEMNNLLPRCEMNELYNRLVTLNKKGEQ